MSVTINDRKINTIRYNGTPINTLRVNNINIKLFDDSIFDNTSFTQAQIIEILNTVNRYGVSLSDYRSKLIGKTITLNNSQDTRTYLPGQYVIADVNHQDMYRNSTSYSSNSIDLIATNSVIANRNFSNTTPYGKWSTSDIRTWLNDTFKNGFDSEIQALMSPMIVENYYGTVGQEGGINITANNNTTDYVKLLSYTELNVSAFDTYMSKVEGAPYSDIFTSGRYDSANTSRVKESYTSSDGNVWWTRSTNSVSTSNAWAVNTNGSCYFGSNGNSNSFGVVPALRLKATGFDIDILSKTAVTYDELLSVIDQENSTYRSQMVGKLVYGINNSLYSGAYRIIGFDHDESENTFDLLTEDCIQSSGFGSSNRHYDDSGCLARIFAEETFYNAFDSTIKEHIKPMKVEYYYSTSTSSTGTLRTYTRYGKLLSFNEIGYGQSGPYKCPLAPSDLEGNLYPYFNNTHESLRIKKLYESGKGYVNNWWLRSRDANNGGNVGIIYTDGTASSRYSTDKSTCLAPVIRIG
jgi:hypothetical protein